MESLVDNELDRNKRVKQSNDHENIVSNDMQSSTKKEQVCTSCHEIFTSRNKLFAHLRSMHNDSIALVTDLDKSNKSISNNIYNRDITLVIAQEDDNYRVIVKPQGLSTMGTNKGEISLHNMTEMILPNKIHYKKAVPCHRLDKATGGLVLCSKNFESEVHIRRCFQDKYIRKRYRAIVVGIIKESCGEIICPVDSKYAHTLFKVVKQSNSLIYGQLTTLDLWPITGKTHQLRKHLVAVGHPIVGDQRYNYSLSYPCDNTPMFLWALEIEFPDPSQPYPIVVSNNRTTDTIETDSNNKFEIYGDENNDEVEGNDVIPKDNERKSSYREANKTSIIPLSSDEFIRRLSSNVRVSFIHVEIPEPEYYDKFRQLNEEQYHQHNQSS